MKRQPSIHLLCATALLAAPFSSPVGAQGPAMHPAYVAEVVATGLPATITDLAVVPVAFGAHAGAVMLCDQGGFSTLDDGQLLVVDPSTGATGVFASAPTLPDGSKIRFGPGGSFGDDLYVNHHEDPQNGAAQGGLSRVDSGGNVTNFGNPCPPGYIYSGVEIVFASSPGFGDLMYTGSSGGNSGDCLSTLSASGNVAVMFHNFGPTPYLGTPSSLTFGNGSAAFGDDLYVSLSSQGSNPPTGIYRFDPASQRTPFVMAAGFALAVSGFGDLQFGPGAEWGTDLYTRANQFLLRLDDAGQPTVIAEFSGGSRLVGLDFDANGYLYSYEKQTQTLYRFRAAAASYSTFGTGCPGSAGTPIIGSSPGGTPAIGQPFLYRVGNVPAVPGIAILVTGLSNSQWNGLPLPADLGPFGMAGCTAYVQPAVTQFAFAAGGQAWAQLHVPPEFGLLGLGLYQQGVVLDPTANVGGATVSNAGLAIVGL